ncbi:C2-domain-containing protein [Dentipellis sp. KUC8613]|nr:C2-domain-containing protein [Dentipellis sp. KUC8613]
MSKFFTQVHEAVSKARGNTAGIAAKTRAFAEEKMLDVPYVDLVIKFIGASGLPKMDVVGSADPYFIAKLDDKIKFVSTVKVNTLTPVWNEMWCVKNVPAHANLHVQVMDKDAGPKDDYIGRFSITVGPGAKEAEIEGFILKRTKGTFWLHIDVNPPSRPDAPAYIFDGPIRFTRHFSPTVGLLTNINDERLYSTWKMYIRGVPLFFGTTTQGWNRDYKAAQSIFGPGPGSLAVRSSIQAGHRMLYARTTRNGFGIIEKPTDILNILHGGKSTLGSRAFAEHRIKPAVYTYVIAIDDQSFRFSETGAAFFVDFASKHALHANCQEAVYYSGEFHPRPEGGWAAFSDDTPDEAVKWELVIDNNSGTYSPDPMMLPNLKELLEYNFPGFAIYAYDRQDPRLTESREACRAYALKYRGVRQEELQPHANAGEETLSHQAAATSESGQGPENTDETPGADTAQGAPSS